MRSSQSTSDTKDSTNGKKPIGAPRIRRLDLGVKQLGGSDIDWFNPYENQTKHFTGCIESPNVPNSFCNHKKTSNTFEVGPIMLYHMPMKEKHKWGRPLQQDGEHKDELL